MILIDDVGCDWIGCYGATQRTPNIDKLATGGVRFQTVWCTPLCSPSRVELLTGRYPFRTGWTDHHDVPRWGGKGLDWEKEVTFARILQQAGYATAIGGKWQINDFRQHPDALKKHGFDEHCVWPGYETGNAPPSDERYWNAYIQTNGKREICKDRFGPDVTNDFLLDFMRRHRDGPFLVYAPLILCHSPYTTTPRNKDNPPKSQKELYADMINYVDYQVGAIMRTVEELGLVDRTMIILAGDNGSSTGGEINGRKYPAGKGQIVNWGVQVPLIIRAPWLSKGGRVETTPADFTDILPTMAQAARAGLRKDVILDGYSLIPLISASAKGESKRKWIYSERGKNRTIRNERFKLDNSGKFWDLQNDPLQQNDLSQSTAAEMVAARNNLQNVLAAMPADAPAPFPEFLKVPADAKKNKE